MASVDCCSSSQSSCGTTALAGLPMQLFAIVRLCSSRAQHDLIEFTLLKAYINADRLDEARHLLRARLKPARSRRMRG